MQLRCRKELDVLNNWLRLPVRARALAKLRRILLVLVLYVRGRAA